MENCGVFVGGCQKGYFKIWFVLGDLGKDLRRWGFVLNWMLLVSGINYNWVF